MNSIVVSDKSRIVALLLSSVLGLFGIHSFYVGRTRRGIAQLVTLGGLGVWAMVDWFVILFGKFKDMDGKVLSKW